jgi:hypothetical protein
MWRAQVEMKVEKGYISRPLSLDPHLEKMTELADRVFCIYNEPARAKDQGKAEARMAGEQRTLEAYS